jgi:hypothetical protein
VTMIQTPRKCRIVGWVGLVLCVVVLAVYVSSYWCQLGYRVSGQHASALAVVGGELMFDTHEFPGGYREIMQASAPPCGWYVEHAGYWCGVAVTSGASLTSTEIADPIRATGRGARWRWTFLPYRVSMDLRTELRQGSQVTYVPGLLHVVVVPLPLLLLTILAGTAYAFWRARRRPERGHCAGCGYDLTGNLSGRCPECGMVYEQVVGPQAPVVL